MRLDQPTKTLMGYLGLLATILFFASAYFNYRGHALGVEAANLRDGTSLAAGLPMTVILLVAVATFAGVVSVSLLVQGRRKATPGKG